MIDPRLTRVAKVLVEYSLQIKKNDRLIIRAKESALPLIREVYRIALIKGAVVDTAIIGEGFENLYFDVAQEHHFATPTPLEKHIYSAYNKFLTIWGESNTRELTNVPPSKMQKQTRGRKAIREKFFNDMGSGKIHWCGTEFPTAAGAQEASLSLKEYEEFFFKACGCDSDKDPIQYWKKISAAQQKIVSKLNRVKEIRIVSKDTDLTARVQGRKWSNCDGHVNFPDGEVFTGPIENSVNGHIRFSFPGIYMGQEIEDIFLEFKDGKVIKAQAAKGDALLQSLLKVDEGASRVGELAIGTNYGIKHFCRNMLFDEKIGGTVHLAIGAGYPETGSKNKSSIHWDMLCDMRKGGRIFGDGKLLYKDGNFLK